MSPRLRIALIASARFPIAQPFAGGLEAHTWDLAHGLRQRGHEVALFAAPGSDPALCVRRLEVRRVELSAAARQDVSMPAADWMQEHHAYLTLMLDLASGPRDRFDVVHNNSLHHLPIAMARAVPTAMITTLHTPPTPWLESAMSAGPCPMEFVAVSAATADLWRHRATSIRVVPNGVDLGSWRPGPGGGPLVWFGRFVPEKGPDLAIAAARAAGLPLVLVGPRPDAAYFAEHVAPRLGPGVSYAGHLGRDALVRLVGRARATLVTPRWDEPYGLVAAESLACGTPVVGFARGGLPEVVDERSAILVPPGDVGALAAALRRVPRLDRRAARRRAVRHCSVRTMVDRYEALYRQLTA